MELGHFFRNKLESIVDIRGHHFCSSLINTSPLFQNKTVAIVDRVDAGVSPALFYLRKTSGMKIKWTFYVEDLTKINEDQLQSYLKIDKFVEQRGEEILCTFQGQPKSFRRWLRKDQIT